ncbi:hypothetical protein [Caenibius sp. WL]|uniref:hypothetical protein n=1 Tax=Caenibius sp. WL TaxID=2872646 RepID=UPI001C98EF10|nr:hypothetical protein [Caenibius sp. WL]QZP08635.1 hypothetical protein K5X80_02220 [Caenibius sp. WL]
MSTRAILSTVAALFTAVALQGCVARAAADIVTAPVKIVGGAVDMATTSQSEADEKRGRALRKQDERYGQLERSYRKEARRCEAGNDDACRKADAARGEMEAIRPTVAPAPHY